ncbi:BirA family transcriptional regulator, biotin operon repressor / biotin-[acetyl-CoA-carboxylase] ligase [Algoriphagus locisalis]|uniref:BirA family transcriptional regulator, biotin operon repressor / biotin-[acetyl-CoA-carboxylase] ligase n=1 Tax=Algoriphagus locisalis TaxID=305507 RepID=A0A1I7E1F0_9BACT|nr:biotin--[acetyl-CoA-carboxylase] ligase [Algoriphagus locisalis]SFU17762.1 BirA family transcriptional regulator, biotin operon repressor / biotin-[acetyl-CoA-carboxylase] ligase [Algoriphagus locisalis]
MYKILANTIFLGKDVHFLPECHSTNDTALNLVRTGQAGEGSVVICNHQTQGKGQRGNVWSSQAGMNLTFSLVLRPDFMDISEQFFLNMAVSNSIRQLLQDYLPTLQVKWPNDLIVPGYGKIGGVLIENTFSGKEWEFAVVGIGLNINQVAFEAGNAASVKAITGSEINLQELFRLLITQLEQGYIQLKKGRWKEIKAEYLNRLYRNQIWANYSANGEQFSAKIVGVTTEGKLEMELENGDLIVFGLKEVVFQ